MTGAPGVVGRLNHVGIAVPDIAAAVRLYRDVLGVRVSDPVALPALDVTVAFAEFPNSEIEFIEPLGEAAALRRFLERNPAGGIHHLCFEVQDIAWAAASLTARGARAIGAARPGARGRPVQFFHPRDFLGTLIEIEEVREERP
jgi:methylmalonyl-CoA/ethylmalonyl-CoA epimerase